MCLLAICIDILIIEITMFLGLKVIEQLFIIEEWLEKIRRFALDFIQVQGRTCAQKSFEGTFYANNLLSLLAQCFIYIFIYTHTWKDEQL